MYANFFNLIITKEFRAGLFGRKAIGQKFGQIEKGDRSKFFFQGNWSKFFPHFFEMRQSVETTIDIVNDVGRH